MRIILAYILISIVCSTTAYSDPAPWESVEVVPRAPRDPLRSSKRVSTEYSAIEKVTFYVKSFCNECKKVESFLKERGVKYERIYSYFTLTGINSIIGVDEDPPVVVVEYSNGTSRKIAGYDEKILNMTFDSYPGSVSDDFKISDFDLRGTKNDTRQDSFDLR